MLQKKIILLYFVVVATVFGFCKEEPKHHTCAEIRTLYDHPIDGLFHIRIDHAPYTMTVYCKNEWIVIQRHTDGHQSFQKNWKEYKNGFGDLTKDFWLGNEKLHILTNIHKPVTVRFDLWDKNNNYRFAEYSTFKVLSEVKKYKLIISGYKGNAGDSMKYHNRYKFSTKDEDNDGHKKYHCSKLDGGFGGWWFNYCIDANLNGQYLKPGTNSTKGISWDMWQNQISLKSSQIRIKFQ